MSEEDVAHHILVRRGWGRGNRRTNNKDKVALRCGRLSLRLHLRNDTRAYGVITWCLVPIKLRTVFDI